MDDVISRNRLREAMYHEAFEVDSDMQKWDGGCWIRYRLFENVLNELPSVQERMAEAVKIFDDPYTGRRFTTCSWCRDKISPKDKYCKHCGAKIVQLKGG